MSVSQFAIPRKCEVPVGAYAVWQIPDLNVTIPVYQGRGGMDSQRQIDGHHVHQLRESARDGELPRGVQVSGENAVNRQINDLESRGGIGRHRLQSEAESTRMISQCHARCKSLPGFFNR